MLKLPNRNLRRPLQIEYIYAVSDNVPSLAGRFLKIALPFFFALFGFVLVGLPLTALLGLLAYFLTRCQPQARLATLAAILLVPVSGLYLIGAVWASSGWLSLRGLDRGLFETYDTPLGHGYVASSQQATGGGELSGPGLTDRRWGVVRAGCAGTRVVLQLSGQGPAPFYALIGGTPTFRTVPSLAQLEAAGGPLHWAEDREPPAACAPHLLWFDRLMQGLLFGLPLAWLVGTLVLVWTVWRLPSVKERPEEEPRVNLDHRVLGVLALTLGAFGVHRTLQGQDRTADIRRNISFLGVLLGFLVVPLLAIWSLTLIGIGDGVLILMRRPGTSGQSGS